MAEKKRKGLLFDEVLPQARRTAQSLLSLDPQEDVPASQQALEMALGFVPGIGQAMALRDIERARRAQDPTAGALAAASLVPFGRLLGRGRSAGPIMSELDVYHGTPHRFPATEANPLGEFDASKIGTGEGAQAYGHGIYYAESPDVAKTYRSSNDPIARKAEMLLQSSDGDVSRAMRYAQKKVEDLEKNRDVKGFFSPVALEQNKGALEYLKQIKSGKTPEIGALYKADLPDEMIDRMLDWDKPINQQSAAIQGALKFEVVKDPEFAQGLSDSKWLLKLNNKVINGYDTRKEAIMSANESTAGQIFNTMNQVQSPSKVAEFYKNAGIPGIKYLDAGSRGQGGSGTRNFVVFPGEEKKVKILERK
jgi:hypothetical protein